MSELEKYLRNEKKSKTVELLEKLKDEIVDLIKKRYTNSEIIRVLNKALKDDEFKRKHKTDLSIVRGDDVRKFLNELRKEIKDKNKDKQKDKNKDKQVVITTKENNNTTSKTESKTESKTTFSSKPKIPNIEEEL
mgnify:CR=1 FL=1